MSVTPWITVDDLDDPSDPHAEEAVEAASWLLWELTARKWNGPRTVTETYCQAGPHETPDFPYPVLNQGKVYNVRGGVCPTCGCPHLIRLRGNPVREIEMVLYEDRYIPLTDVKIYDYSWIGLSPTATACWMTCGDLLVTYTYGARPPAMGRRAARVLANEFILAENGDADCMLPERVTQVNRQGVSWTLMDPQDFLDEGRTGITSVDLFIRAANPEKARRRARVFNPDIPRGKTRR